MRELHLGFAKSALALNQFAFRALAILDVVRCCVPGNKLSVSPQRNTPRYEPAVFAIGSSKAKLRLERLTCANCGVPSGFEPRNVIGVSNDAGACGPFRRGE